MSAKHTDFDLPQTATQHHLSFDWPRLFWTVAYWGTLAGIILFLAFVWGRGAAPHVAEKINDGTATVNINGTVTLWTDGAEAVTGLDRKRMLGNDVFFALPESRRMEIRKCFDRSLMDDKLYPWPRVRYDGVMLTFRRESNRIEAVFSR